MIVEGKWGLDFLQKGAKEMVVITNSMEVMRFNSYVGRQTRIDEAGRYSAAFSLVLFLLITALTCLCSARPDAGETRIAAAIISGIAAVITIVFAIHAVDRIYWWGGDFFDILVILAAVVAIAAFVVLLYSGALVASIIGAVAAGYIVFVLAVCVENYHGPKKNIHSLIMCSFVVAAGVISFGILYWLPRLI
jgi:hypothetical protein